MARASLIQFSSGSHSSADLQSVHARKHSAFAVALILAFVAKNPSYRIVQAEQTPNARIGAVIVEGLLLQILHPPPRWSGARQCRMGWMFERSMTSRMAASTTPFTVPSGFWMLKR